MRLPPWIVVSDWTPADGRSIEFRLRLSRYWWAHPGFWVFLLRRWQDD